MFERVVKMKLEDFQKISDKYQKKLFWESIPPVAALIIGIIATVISVFLFKNKYKFENPYLNEIFPYIIASLLFLSIFAVGVLISRRAMKTTAKNCDYHCPHCGELIADKGFIVMATGNCPHCGKQVIDKD
jgi:predicted RNA-binding Zn-ribbon protein involved in translation (DUF1610 family)